MAASMTMHAGTIVAIGISVHTHALPEAEVHVCMANTHQIAIIFIKNPKSFLASFKIIIIF